MDGRAVNPIYAIGEKKRRDEERKTNYFVRQKTRKHAAPGSVIPKLFIVARQG
jgi:hypothetical protein